jgi:hypothetical protein
MRVRRTPTRLLAAAVATATAIGLTAVAGSSSAEPDPGGERLAGDAGSTAATLKEYAADTWRSFDAMTVERTGLPDDNIGGDLDPASRGGYTSPTNIGAYLWSTVTARDVGLISSREARQRMGTTLKTVAGLEKHEPSGMFYNWYSPTTGEKLREFPNSGDPIKPFLSSVDNGWLATGLLLTARAEPALADKANAIRKQMDFSCYYNPEVNQIRGGFWDEDPDNPADPRGNYCDMPKDVWYTGHHYGAFNTEPRMASYLGIAAGQLPQKHYFGTFRTFPNDAGCDWAWTETNPKGEWREYKGVRVFEGTLPYRGMDVVPTWGGSMFEALMVPLFVPEEKWGPRSWAVNHPLYVRGQIEHGMEDAGYGYWGFSPSNNPAGGYREFGVDPLGLDGPGYTSDLERTAWEQPYEGCREGQPAPTEYGDGVVTPHASFLAMRYAPHAALANLQRIRDDFDAYGPGGFYDAVAVRSGRVSQRYLSLDQGMIMAALGNALTGDNLRSYVSDGALQKRVRPLMEMEEFGNGGAARP